MKRLFVIILLTLCSAEVTFSQSKPQNIPYYDDKVVIFGGCVGGNMLYSNMVTNKILPYNDTIMSLNATSEPGFTVGFQTDLRLLSFLRLRCMQNVTFSQRSFDFSVLQNGSIHKTHTSFEVIYFEVPLELKLFAKRWRDFRPYLIGGMKYSFDLGSIKRKKMTNNEFLFKTEDHELSYVVGVGFDFYMEFFKLSVELKSSFGLNDVLNKEFKTVYSDCIDKIKTQMFYVNFIFQ